jgi:peptide/nickel transport system permease protein
VLAFVVRRVLLAAVVLAVFSVTSFCLFSRLQPPNGIPLLTQYWTWLKGVTEGSSLHSILHGNSGFFSSPSLLGNLGHTAALLGVAMLLVVVFSIGLATAAARWRGSLLDVVLRGASYFAWAVPAFLLGLVVQQVVSSAGSAHGLGPFPLAGWPGSCPASIGLNYGNITPCRAAGSGAEYALNVLRYVALPAATLAIGFVGFHARYLRSALLDVLDAPYITTARAKGLPERMVVLRHALRVSLSTFVSALLGDFGVIFGAALAVDWVFKLGGLGTRFILLFNPNNGAFSLYSMEALVLVTAVLVLVSSLLSELAVDWLDPRVRATR